jgi:hypothetical protein
MKMRGRTHCVECLNMIWLVKLAKKESKELKMDKGCLRPLKTSNMSMFTWLQT